MKLHTQEQVYYTLPNLSASSIMGPISVLVDKWEASFDGGATWHASQAHPDLPLAPCWLIRGAGFIPPDEVTPLGILVGRNVTPLIRLRGTPEADIAAADAVQVWR